MTFLARGAEEVPNMPYPFYNKEFEFTQPDGTQIRLRGWGNQNYAVFETLDGFTVIKDPVTGYYEYAKLSADGSFLEPTGIRVGLVDPAVLGIEKHIRISKEAAKQESRMAYHMMAATTRWEERRQEAKQAKRMAAMSMGFLPAPPKEEKKGDYIGLCILVQFPDVPGTIPQSEVEKFCNKQGYTGFGNAGSVHDYFSDASGGKLKYTNIVTQYYTARNPRDYYTNPAISHGRRARELILEALEDLKAKGFDFSSLSTDNKGFVYALNVFYAGPIKNNWREGLWPHSWDLGTSFDIGNGKKLYDYQITNMGSELTLETFCHENGHMVCDFPDLYDYGAESNGVGSYCLMCFGGTDEKNPVQICAYLKYKAGWADQVTPLTDGTYTAKAGTNEFFIAVKNPIEYYILENRHRENRDRSLPSSGLAVWHVDELGSNEYEDMTPEKHYECSIVQADNRFDLEHRVNKGDANDLFNKNTGPKFGNSTKPHSRWWDGTPSGLEIIDIGDAGKDVTFRFVKKEGEFKKASSPAKAIPDNDPIGISDKIVFDDDAVVSSLKVDIDITHPYIGDLKVTLISPSGARAILHNRKGGSADNLKTTLDVASTPELGNIIGKPLRGEWVLSVQDVAASDKGILNNWGLEIGGSRGSVIEMEDEAAEKIPDDSEMGIARSMTLEASGQVKSMEVAIDITHTYIGDLKVTLMSPKGTSIDLHNRSGSGQDNLIKTYSASTTPDLAKLSGESIGGKWTLKVVDLAREDVGKLNRWSLKIIPFKGAAPEILAA
ncbi:M6 family metalloprotease domain-containing protein [Methanosarcina sp. KYL-1]|nr:M6 family metalloprotease domain-containing protein [Methanosarcina sp. KYL-1]